MWLEALVHLSDIFPFHSMSVIKVKVKEEIALRNFLLCLGGDSIAISLTVGGVELLDKIHM